MKRLWIIFCLLTITVVLQGCETLRGAKEGFKKDMEAIMDEDSKPNKVDAWIQEHLW